MGTKNDHGLTPRIPYVFQAHESHEIRPKHHVERASRNGFIDLWRLKGYKPGRYGVSDVRAPVQVIRSRELEVHVLHDVLVHVWTLSNIFVLVLHDSEESSAPAAHGIGCETIGIFGTCRVYTRRLPQDQNAADLVSYWNGKCEILGSTNSDHICWRK